MTIALGATAACRLPGCSDRTAPYTGQRQILCLRHQRIYAALQVLCAEGVHCPGCGILPDIQLISDFADYLAASQRVPA